MSRIREALIYSSASQYFLKLLNFISIAVFARLLTPAELGILAIASSAIIIASELRLLGTTNYLVREKEISSAKIQSGIGLTLLISWSLGFIILLSSQHIADFYELDELATVFNILSINFFLAPFISVTSSILTRELQFKKLMLVNFLSEITRFLASLILVLLGYSYLGLAWGILAGSILELILLRFLKTEITSWQPSFKNLKPIVKFGLFSSCSNLLARFDSTTPDLIIGKFGTTSQVAFFSKGVGLLTYLTQLISAGIWPVALPYLSNVKRDNGNVQQAYIKATLLLGSICWPVLVVAGVVSFPMIMLVFGDQWVDSIPLVSVLSIWALFRIIHTLSPSLLITMGHEKLLLYKQILIFCITIVSLYVGFKESGVIGVAWSMAFVGVIDFIISGLAIKKAIQLRVVDFVWGMRLNIILCFICWSVVTILDYFVKFDHISPMISFFILSLAMPICWFLGVKYIKHPIYDEIIKILNPILKKLTGKFQ